MYYYTKLSCYFISIILLAAGCTTARTVFYSYKVDTYVTDTVRHILSSSRLISCGDYLFEFKLGQKYSTESTMQDDGTTEVKVSPIYFDTMGIYLLANKQYFEFDTFALNNRMIKKGGIGDKEFGVKMGDGSTVINYTPPFISKPKDTIINNISCYYVDILGNKTSPVSDTVSTKLILIKNKKFTSLLKIYGLNAMNNEYCIVSLCNFHKLRQESYLQEIDSLRPVTKAERAICESMIQKAGLPLPK
jgi:hypothetical protein